MRINVGKKSIHSNLTEHKTGDVIRFRFQPQTKKLLIYLIRVNDAEIKDDHYEVDLQDNVNYFPVVQATGSRCAKEFILIE